MEFINPYNFVSCSTDRTKDSDADTYIGSNTGVIVCEMGLRTPLIIPDVSCDDVFSQSEVNRGNAENRHKSYDFFSYNPVEKDSKDGPEYPVIPGSQIRGVIRNAYETITNSCFPMVNEDTVVARRVSEAKKPGIIYREGDKIFLNAAKRYMLQLENYGYVNREYGNVMTKILKLFDKKRGEYVGFFKVANMLNDIMRKHGDDSPKTLEITKIKADRKAKIDKLKEYMNEYDNILKEKKEAKKAKDSIRLNEINARICEIEKELKIINDEYKRIGDFILDLYYSDDNDTIMNKYMIREGDSVFFNNNFCDDFKKSRGQARVIRDYHVKEGDKGKTNLFKFDNGNLYEGKVHFGENFGDSFPGKRHHESVFTLLDKTPIDITERFEKIHKQLNRVLAQYEDKGINVQLSEDYMLHKGHRGYKIHLDRFCKKEEDYLCVYYSEVGGEYYFSPSQITKEVYNNQIKDVIGQKKPCSNKKSLCPACALFGMTSETSAISSRVRFTDAEINGKPTYGKVVTLSILGSPKSSAAEFYLKKEGKYWNYDYTVDSNDQKKLYDAIIRGRKFYWHHSPKIKEVSIEDIKTRDFNNESNIKSFVISGNLSNLGDINKAEQKRINKIINELNGSFRPIDEGSFVFKVYFENLSDEELKTLVWVLTIGGNDTDGCHKIGHGKPLGFGSVKIKITNIQFRSIDLDSDEKTYQTNHEDNVKQWCVLPKRFNNLASKKEFEIITDFNALSEKEKDIVSYPYNGRNRDEVFKWFQANVPLGKEMIIKNILPDINARNKSLQTVEGNV